MNRYPRGSASDAAGLVIFVYVALIGLAKFNFEWDTLAYHIPFAALRVGLISSDQFVLPPNLEVRYHSFPPFVDYFQGILFAATGRPEATSLISPLGAFLLALYMRIAYKVPIFWTACIFLAVPTLHAALDAGYVDLWTNSFFVVHLFAAWRVITSQRPRMQDTIIANIALLVAVNSKEQFFIIGASSFAIIIVILCCKLFAKRKGDGHLYLLPLIIFLVLAPLTFFSPIRNLIIFHNPIYPIAVRIGGYRFPGPETGLWQGPAALPVFRRPFATYSRNSTWMQRICGHMGTRSTRATCRHGTAGPPNGRSPLNPAAQRHSGFRVPGPRQGKGRPHGAEIARHNRRRPALPTSVAVSPGSE